MMADGIDDARNESIADLESSINSLICSIREKLEVDNPALLMACVLQLEDFGNTMAIGDGLVTSPPPHYVHTGEYLQSLLTLQNPAAELKHEDRVDAVASSLLKDLEDLSALLRRHLVLRAQEQVAENPALDLFPYEAQLMRSVQGKRYTCFEDQYHRCLLPVHDDELRKIFGIGSDELLAGFGEMRHQLTYGKVDDLNALARCLEVVIDGEAREHRRPSDEDRAAASTLVQRCFTEQRYEVDPLGVWPERFVAALSWELGGAYQDSDPKSVWPDNAHQVKKRPFIKIGGSYYCFDYYAFVDSFYRAVQHALIEADPEYKETWQERQKDASETAVADVLERILPGCECYTGNYYGNKKSRRENDVLIRYMDALLIVEVKAGGFALESPLENITAHINRYKSLIEKGGDQCWHVLEALNRAGRLSLMDSIGNEKAVIEMSEITSAYSLSVTVENVNSVAAKAEKQAFLDMHHGIVSIALDDLMVYEDFFDNPLVFLHFLKHRTAATANRRIALSDELDHLGFYIEKNCYELATDEYPDDARLVFAGLRDELDVYYETRGTPLEQPSKPSLDIPRLMLDILGALARQAQGQPVFGSSLLLDISDRSSFCKTLEEELGRQKKTGRQDTIVMAIGDGNMPVICFVDQPGVIIFKHEVKRERVATEILGTDHERGALLNVRFDEYGAVAEASFEIISKELIAPERLEEFQEQRYRLMMARGLKPGRNEPCPCGSGKKYKRCHGR